MIQWARYLLLGDKSSLKLLSLNYIMLSLLQNIKLIIATCLVNLFQCTTFVGTVTYVSWQNTKQQLLICCWYLEPWANSFGMCYWKISILCKWRPQRSHVAGEGIIKQWPPAVSDFYWMAIFLWWNTAFSLSVWYAIIIWETEQADLLPNMLSPLVSLS